MSNYVVDNDPRSIPPDQYRHLFRTYLEEHEFEQVTVLLLRQGGPEEHYSVVINCETFVKYDYALAHYVFNHPKLLIPIFEEALLELQSLVAEHPSFLQKWKQKGTVKELCHIRIVSLPSTPKYVKNTISDIKAQDVNSFIQISGTIVRTGGVRMLELSKQYECQNPKCRFRFTVFADPEQDNMLPQPRCCPAFISGTNKNSDANSYNPFSSEGGVESSTGKKKCNSPNLRELEGCNVCVDYQEIKIQDHIDRLSLGSVPRSVIVILQCDLVDKFNPGDDVVVVGSLIRQWRSVSRGCRCVIDIAVEANSVTSVNSTEKLKQVSENSTSLFVDFWNRHRASKDLMFQARNTIVRAVCPQLFGLFYVKLSLLLALIGGSATSYEGGVRRRSQSHMLIVGDPGCGKSQLLRFAAAVTPRSVLTTGVGTTGAGLTCTAVRDGPDWCLEAGALVLSNDGVCCIDEFASIREQDRATVHEAMEQQTLSIAKAGMVVKLNTRSTVIACCNPKGSYDLSLDISANTAIASPLLSRFDIILILLDTADKEWDKYVSTYLLLQAVNQTTSAPAKPAASAAANGGKDVKGLTWDLETLKQYIACVKTNIQPELTPAARCLLMRYYQLQRQSDEHASARTTVRLLESLLRLSEAHAKLMFRDKVWKEDAIVAIHCISLSNPLGTSLLDSTKFSIKEGFSDDPAAQYQIIEEHIFNLLRLNDESFARLVQDEGKTEPSEPLFRSPAKVDGGMSQFNPFGSSSDGSSSCGGAVHGGRHQPVPLEPPGRVTVTRPTTQHQPAPAMSPATSSQWNTQNYAPPNSSSSNGSSSISGSIQSGIAMGVPKSGLATRTETSASQTPIAGQKRKVEEPIPSVEPSFKDGPISASVSNSEFPIPPGKTPLVRVATVPLKPPVPVVTALTQPLQVSQSVSALLQDEEW